MCRHVYVNKDATLGPYTHLRDGEYICNYRADFV